MNIDLRSPYSTKLKQTVCKKESQIKYSRANCNLYFWKHHNLDCQYKVFLAFFVSLFRS